jgi:hypothetical protein
MTFFCNILMVVCTQIGVWLPSPEYLAETAGAYNHIFTYVPRIVLGSLVGFLLGELSNAWFMERIKQKKERLLDMRTDGEITKEEFLHQRQKLDAELQILTAEYEILSHPSAITLDQPEWGKIQDALEEILDLSQPKPSPDLIRKFVTKIVPDGKTNFRWYMNLDGSNTTVQDMTVEGRKNKAVVTLCQEEDDDTPDSRRVIHLQTVTAFPSPLVMPHRLLSRTEGFERLPQVRNLYCDH